MASFSSSSLHHLPLAVLFLVVVMSGIGEKQQLLVRASDDLDHDSTRFDQNYAITWGYDRVSFLDQGTLVKLSMDKSSGAGFESKLNYASGYFLMRIKLPGKDSSGVVTAYYLTSKGDNHDELDFEFLGNKEGNAIILQTNVFVNGVGNREQRIHLWFDPTTSFHTYGILWNQRQIMFFIDDTPIRVYKKKMDAEASYPSRPMKIEVSLWDGESWATDGGKRKTDWTQAPFEAYFKGFNVSGCPTITDSNTQPCYSPALWWNTQTYWALNPSQQAQYEAVKSKYVTYDYCSDRVRYPTPPPECAP